MAGLQLRVLGCRGSMSVAGEAFTRYGGNTTCFAVEVEEDHHLVVDCGTGLRHLQHAVTGRGPQRFTMLLTHYHWDHIQGLPVFMPLFDESTRIALHGPCRDGRSVDELLDEVLRPPWWPVTLSQAAATVSFHDAGDPLRVGSVSVTSVAGHHPQGVRAYRLEGPNRSVVIATDHETGDTDADARVRSLASGADVLIHDAQYTPEQVRHDRTGWGHSSFEAAVIAAHESSVSRLILTSHDPDRSDAEIDRLRGMARATFPHTDAAYEGMTIEL